MDWSVIGGVLRLFAMSGNVGSERLVCAASGGTGEGDMEWMMSSRARAGASGGGMGCMGRRAPGVEGADEETGRLWQLDRASGKADEHGQTTHKQRPRAKHTRDGSLLPTWPLAQTSDSVGRTGQWRPGRRASCLRREFALSLACEAQAPLLAASSHGRPLVRLVHPPPRHAPILRLPMVPPRLPRRRRLRLLCYHIPSHAKRPLRPPVSCHSRQVRAQLVDISR